MSGEGEPVSADQLRCVEVPAHLLLNVRVIDDDGTVLAEGRNLADIRAALGDRPTSAVVRPSPATGGAYDRNGLTDWVFGRLPESVTLHQNRLRIVRYPAIDDCGDSVAVTLCDSSAEALERTRAGVSRLLVLCLSQQARYIRRRLLDRNETVLLCHGLCAYETLTNDLLTAAVRRTFDLDDPPRTAEAFKALLERGRAELVPVASRLADLVQKLLTKRRDVLARMNAERLPDDAERDLRAHLDRLMPADFLVSTPPNWLAELPRFLEAVARRVERLAQGRGGDRERMARLAPFEQRYYDALEYGADAAALVDYRWLLEEFRVSLFAQHLGTSQPVSPARLDRLWAKASRE